MLCADLLFITGSLLLASSSTVAQAVAGRAIIGMATGLSSVASSLYVAETAPARHRGRLIIATILLVTAGQVLGFVVAGAFAAWSISEAGWRWTIALGAVPATIQAFMVIFVMPDSPRWLVMVGRVAAAQQVLQRIHGGGGDDADGKGGGEAARRTEILVKNIQAEAREMQQARQRRQHQPRKTRYAYQRLGPWNELFAERRHRRALAIACLLQALQQLSGFVSSANAPTLPPTPFFYPCNPGSLRCHTWLTSFMSLLEFAHVLLGHHIPAGRLQEPDYGFTSNRLNQLCIYCDFLSTHR